MPTPAPCEREERLVRADGKPFTIACVGDAVTVGANSSPGFDYPSALKELLGENVIVKNMGVAQTTVLKTTLKKTYMGTFLYNKTLDLVPDVILIMLGAVDAQKEIWNDWWQNFDWDFKQFVKTFKELVPQPRIILMKPPPVYGGSRDGVGPDGKYDFNIYSDQAFKQSVQNGVLPGTLERIARENGLEPPIDVFETFKMHCPNFDLDVCDWMAGDFPSDRGYEQIAKAVEARLTFDPCAS